MSASHWIRTGDVMGRMSGHIAPLLIGIVERQACSITATIQSTMDAVMDRSPKAKDSGMAMVQCGADVVINAAHISTIEWERGHSYTIMVVTMQDGRAIRMKHQPPYGLDCYAVEAKLLEASQLAHTAGRG